MALELSRSYLYGELIEYRELVEFLFFFCQFLHVYQTYKGIEMTFPFRLFFQTIP